jgi:hypothetical protein
MITTKRVTLAAITAALLVVIYFIASSVAFGGFTASVRNTNNAIGTGTSFLTAASGGATQCSSVPAGNTVPATTTFPCINDQFPLTPATGSGTRAVSLIASGTTNFTSATYNASACAPVKMNNSQQASDPMLVRGGVGFAQAGPTAVSGSGSTSFNGTDSLAVNVASISGLTNFTLGIWFKTSTASGALFGFSSSPSTIAGSTYDRHMYMSSNGKLNFSTYSGGARTITSTSTVTDNVWHYAVVTGQSAVTTGNSRITMYIDGTQQATLTFANAAAAEPTTGYWRVGQARTDTGYPGTGQFFTGNLSNFTVVPTALAAADVTALYTAGSQTAYAAKATAVNATGLWPLNDSGLDTYTGTLPGNAGNPCAHVRVSVGTATSCVYPVSATTCPALSSTYTLNSLVASSASPLTPSTPSSPQTLTTTLARDTSYNANYDVGLHLLVPVSITENGFTQTFTWSTNETII